ncbi:translation initiation factor IF-2 [Triticum aestivum]|uniref:translation initiation factor IF-2 n=1 Tax=Triticum aestivum TaxID=4565 RepID=UPI001D001ED5|nr:translation initiation factor IF-2-like [Triticum aestivum]
MPPKRPWLLARIRVAQSAYDQRDSHRQGRRPATGPPREAPKVTPWTRSMSPTTSEPPATTASRGTVPSRPGEGGGGGAAYGHDRHLCAGDGVRNGAPVAPTSSPPLPRDPLSRPRSRTSRSAREHRPPPTAEEEGARNRQAAAMRGHQGGPPAPSAAVQPQGPGWTGPPPSTAAMPPLHQRSTARGAARDPQRQTWRRGAAAATHRPAPPPCRPSPDATPPSLAHSGAPPHRYARHRAQHPRRRDPATLHLPRKETKWPRRRRRRPGFARSCPLAVAREEREKEGGGGGGARVASRTPAGAPREGRGETEFSPQFFLIVFLHAEPYRRSFS